MDRDDREPGKHEPGGASRWAAYLDWVREDLAATVLALPEDVRRSSALPSGWTPIELLSHVLHMEQRWFVWGFLGEPVDEPWGDWTVEEPWDQDDGALGGRRRRDSRAAGGAAGGDRGADDGDPARLPARRDGVAGRPVRRRPAEAGVDLLPRAGGVRPARGPARRGRRGESAENSRRPVPPSGPKPSARYGSSGTGRGTPPRARGSPRSATAGVTSRTLGLRFSQAVNKRSTRRQGFVNKLDSGRAPRLRHRFAPGLRGAVRRRQRGWSPSTSPSAR